MNAWKKSNNFQFLVTLNFKGITHKNKNLPTTMI